jgi:uncharacterized protein YcbX
MHLSEINIYPVKSLKGIPFDEALVEERGLRFDRRWMLVDADSKFITQREFPVMAAVRISLEDDGLLASFNGRQLRVPLTPENGAARRVSIWSSSVKAVEYPAECSEWFSEVLNIDCRLVMMPDESRRTVNPFYAVRKFKDTVSFADGYPFMLLGQSSLDDLNTRLPDPVPMNRFRPNFVVSGSGAFAEDDWKKIRIGTTVFHVVKPSERCVMPTIDQAAGVKTGVEPLKTLSGFRTTGNKVLFGQNLIAENPGGVVKVDDAVEVLE